MWLETSTAAYYNAREWWIDHHPGYLWEYTTILFEGWLNDQGASIDRSARRADHYYISDEVDVCIGVDTIFFKNSGDLTYFILRWS